MHMCTCPGMRDVKSLHMGKLCTTMRLFVSFLQAGAGQGYLRLLTTHSALQVGKTGAHVQLL